MDERIAEVSEAAHATIGVSAGTPKSAGCTSADVR
jgi:hypothetical protein